MVDSRFLAEELNDPDEESLPIQSELEEIDLEEHVSPVHRFIHHVSFSDRLSGMFMLVFAVAGLVLANLSGTSHFLTWLSQFQVGFHVPGLFMSVHDWCQNGLLSLFFLVVGLELKQELATGSLSDPRKAIVPMLGAAGGMVAPSLIYILILWISVKTGLVASHGLIPADLSRGWAVPTATDIAFSLAVFALFSNGLPREIRSFLLTLATVDDFLGILLIALLFTSFNQWYWFVGIAVTAVMWYFIARMKKIPKVLAIIVCLTMWYFFEQSGVHSTLAGVLIGLLAPADLRYDENEPRAQRWHDALTPLSVLVALPLFAFFATAINVTDDSWTVLTSPIILGIVAALIIGKPLGVLLMTWVSVHLAHLKLADGLKVRDLIGMACTCGIGFTVSFLIAALAFNGAHNVEEARLAVLIGSVLSACIAGFILHLQAKNPKYQSFVD